MHSDYQNRNVTKVNDRHAVPPFVSIIRSPWVTCTYRHFWLERCSSDNLRRFADRSCHPKVGGPERCRNRFRSCLTLVAEEHLNSGNHPKALPKKEKQRKLPSAALRLVPSPRYFAKLFKRSRTTLFTVARTMPTPLCARRKRCAGVLLDRNHELTHAPGVVLHTFVIRHYVAPDKFRLPNYVQGAVLRSDRSRSTVSALEEDSEFRQHRKLSDFRKASRPRVAKGLRHSANRQDHWLTTNDGPLPYNTRTQ